MRRMLKMTMLEQTTINISRNKNDKNSIYVGDLVGAMLGIEEARENILDFCKRQENITREIETKIPKMIETIDRYFKE
jgi:hypothetical protein